MRNMITIILDTLPMIFLYHVYYRMSTINSSYSFTVQQKHNHELVIALSKTSIFKTFPKTFWLHIEGELNQNTINDIQVICNFKTQTIFPEVRRLTSNVSI